jgi:hypothetical protein
MRVLQTENPSLSLLRDGFSFWSSTYANTGTTDLLEARSRSPLRLRAPSTSATARVTDSVTQTVSLRLEN